jgi:hypothetical protein
MRASCDAASACVEPPPISIKAVPSPDTARRAAGSTARASGDGMELVRHGSFPAGNLPGVAVAGEQLVAGDLRN